MIKYRLLYKSFDNSEWLVTFDIKDFEGDAVNVRGVAGQACTLTYEGSAPDDVWKGIITTASADINVYNQGQIDLIELLGFADKDCLVTVYRNNEIKFKGYLIVDGMYIDYQTVPHPVQLRSICGLNMLDGMRYAPFGAELGDRCPLNYFRRILVQQLGIDLPIRWSTSLQALNEEISGDPFINAKWAQYGDGVIINPTTNRIQYKSCLYIIEGLTKAFQCRIVQADGAWWILGIHEHHKDIITYSQCANSTGLPVVTQHARDSVRHIGSDYSFVKEDSKISSTPGLGSFEITYENSQLENILPNGGLDQRVTGQLTWWNVDESSGIIMQEFQDITGRGGSAVQLRAYGSENRSFRLVEPLPIDGHILFKTFQWGFSFLPISGFQVDQNGNIDWTKRPLKASVKYTVEENGTIVDYYLNEFGYWQSSNGPANQQVTGTSWHPSGDSFSIAIDQNKNFDIGDQVNILIIRGGAIIRHTITFSEPMDVENGTNFIADQINDGFTSAPNAWTVSINNTDNDSRNTASTRKELDYFKYIHFKTTDPLKLNVEAVAFNYQGAGSLENKIVDPGNIYQQPTLGAGLLSIEFIVQPGQDFVLDDIWMKLNSNKDVYKASYNDLGNTKGDEDTLNISTSFSGFMGSNLMQRYSTSNIDWKYTDGIAVGTLTDLYAQAFMRFRYKSSIIFESSISTRGKDWSYIDNYTIEGLDGKFIPCSSVSYNTEDNEVRLYAMQARNDNIQLTIEHYGTEDQEKDNII